jgi:cofilin
VAALPADDCRYALYDMDFTTTDGRPANKLVFISWCVNHHSSGTLSFVQRPLVFSRRRPCPSPPSPRAPDSATVKKKMIFAGSKDALTRAFVGVGTKVSATDMSELTEEILIEACRKFA